MGKRILVADDDPVVGILVNEYLTPQGHTIEVVSSGSQCLEKLSHEVPDILILDFIMPDMTGIDVLRNIRENHSSHSLPVIMLSADSENDRLLDQLGLHAALFLEKPFGSREIADAVEEITRALDTLLDA